LNKAEPANPVNRNPLLASPAQQPLLEKKMKPKLIIMILFLIAFQISSSCFAEDYKHFLSIKTRFGLVQVVQSFRAGPYDVIEYRGKKILHSRISVFSLGGYLRLKDSDVVLVHGDTADHYAPAERFVIEKGGSSMKNIFLVILLLLLTAPSYADQRAITDTGEQVILKDNGTWIYADKTQKSDQKIETNTIIFNRPQDSTFLLKSIRNKSAFWINPDKWNLTNPK
jgi:hypothetical protein